MCRMETAAQYMVNPLKGFYNLLSLHYRERSGEGASYPFKNGFDVSEFRGPN
jgi:hypothetical protein